MAAKSRLLQAGYRVRDPMDRDFRGREGDLTDEIVEGDKSDIESSGYLPVNHPGPSSGTDMEIIYAWGIGVRVVTVVPPGARISPWVSYHSEKIFASFDQALAYLGA